MKTGVRVREFGGSKRKQVMSDIGKYKRAAKADVAYNMMRMWQGAVGVVPVDGLVSPAYVVARPFRDVESQYFVSLFRTGDYLSEIDNFSRGIVKDRNRLYWDQFKQMPSPCPPSGEQAEIARFLGWANGRLERAIRAKWKVISLLQEQKQAIIHRAVTRGLDPNVPLKPSGISWLGDIPKHWDVRRSKYLFREQDERSKTGEETHLGMSQRLGLVPSDQVESSLRSESYAGGKLCRAGDLVLNRLKAHLGVFAVAYQDGVISPDYSVFRKRTDIDMSYYEGLLRSSACRSELRVRAKGIVEGFWRLYTDDFYDIRLPFPPISEQTDIMTSVVIETADLNTVISRTEREIDLFKEYRTRLTADVVTGKLDVREAARSLPVESVDNEVESEPDDHADSEEDLI